MDAFSGNSQFRWGRFAAVSALAIVAGVLAVEVVSPEKRFSEAAAVAEVVLRTNESKTPTADQVRRRALSTANLSAVWRRFTGNASGEPVSEGGDEIAATIERWRKQIAVEVRGGAAPGRCRVRFLVVDEHRNSNAAILAEAVAAQYASELAAESWYALVDQLRSAEDRSDAAIDRLLVAAGKRTVGLSRFTPERIPFQSTMSSPEAYDDEIVRLTQMRERLLESLTPEHPEVVAVDARLDSIVAAIERSPIRRMSGELDRHLTTLHEPPMQATAAASPSIAAAAADVAEARAKVRSRLDDLTTPGAVEAPVVISFNGVGGVWELRSFWRLIICFPGLLLAWSISRGNHRVSASSASSPMKARKRKTAAAEAISRESAKPVYVQGSRETTTSNLTMPETTLDTLEQVAHVVGAPVLAVVTRRREPRPTATA